MTKYMEKDYAWWENVTTKRKHMLSILLQKMFETSLALN